MLRRGLGLAAIIIILDQLSKYWIVERVMRPEGVTDTPFFSPVRVEILPIFDLVMAWNRGVSFGIFNNGGDWNWLALSVLSVAISAGLVVWLKKAENALVALALGAIIGGALGNVIDRLRWGAVADFLDVHVAGYHWPAFNVADSAISVGAVLLILDSLFTRRNSDKN
ncbi:signal peptidase II [Magnetospirillum moscoviense]|uniref:Lipoprotein signal peptidase n=1 Tax=Magnetospirillum moscoviense TaxID=1437059 RepID=A0A178MVZ8_9PROT|nr:signal peptidase II [Magnetospirillum moscoviense]MBF0326076.1 signal peptidase II [Alphaproteobacteria bacterium]OAN54174.1 signal peptidase II [Magnetospirillum moscoviense]